MTPKPDSTSTGPTGPRSEAGKSRCRLNAFRHGLTGHVFVFAEEEAPKYRKYHDAIRGHYQPSGPLEDTLVDQIANGLWRLQRIHAIEEGLYAFDSAPDPAPGAVVANPLLGPAGTWLSEQRAFDLLGRYEGRIRRALDRDKAELNALQSARKQEAAEALDRAVGLHRLAKLDGKPYDPSAYFPAVTLTAESVFSPEFVAAESDRREAQGKAQLRLAQLQRQPKAA